MQIQPYFPEPIDVARNVATERYVVRLSFIRAVLAGHALSAVAVVAVAAFLEPRMHATGAVLLLFACLLALTLVRRLLPGRSLDGIISFFLLLPTLFALGTLCRVIADAGEPVWIVGAGYVVASVYGAVCGRDYSFVGQFVIAAIALVAICSFSVFIGGQPLADVSLWFAIALTFDFYFIYDLAALLSRRRLGEETAAVADLYRDSLNFTTYAVRVYLHWRRFGPI